MTWFERLMGFREQSPEQVRSLLELSGEELVSLHNGKRYRCGTLEVVSLDELAGRSSPGMSVSRKSTIQEVVADVKELHIDAKNAGSLFQVASQFNLLEMVGPEITPEMGVGIYENDRTQGPACAMACGAGTIYRNYLVPIGSQTGQTESLQINCLEDFEKALGEFSPISWHYKNGYILPDAINLKQISDYLRGCSESELRELRGLVRIGIQWDTQVTLAESKHCVSQAYCSALPVAYGNQPAVAWEAFARLVLEAAYEATFHAAVLNRLRNGKSTVFLTLLGGGAFGNNTQWILESLGRGFDLFRDAGLDVRVVSYGRSNPQLVKFLRQTGEEIT